MKKAKPSLTVHKATSSFVGFLEWQGNGRSNENDKGEGVNSKYNNKREPVPNHSPGTTLFMN